MMDWTAIGTIVSLGIASYSLVKAQFVSRESALRDTDIALLKKQSDLFWRMVETHMTTVLHSPHTPDRDKLLEKIQEGVMLTDTEIDDLAADLKTIVDNPQELQGNRAAAVFLLAVVERYKQRIGEFAPQDVPSS